MTAAHEAERAGTQLRELAFLQTLMDSLGEGVFACDAEGRLTVFNPAMREFLGRGVADGPPEGWASIYGLRDPETGRLQETDQLPLYRALQGEVVVGADLLVQRHDGEQRTLSVNARPLVDAEGRCVGAVGTARDVTEHRRALRRMQEAERLAGVGVWEFHLETREVFWSDGMYRILGADREALAPDQDAWNARIHPDDIEPAYRQMEATLASGASSWEQMYRLYREDGSLRTLRAHVETIVDADGVVRRLQGTVQDFTERVEAEAALRRSELRARQIDRMESLGQLAGGIAHDFNNLLAVMLTFSEFVLEDLAPDSPVRGDVEEIARAATRAADLTQRLLMFSRGEAVRARPLDIGALVRQVEPMLHRTLGEHLDISIHVPAELILVSADATQLEHVVLNLALNARDAMPRGGRLSIAVSTQHLEDGLDEQLAPGRYVCIEVTDTGVGMTPEVAARVFDPFFTTKPKGQGTGLGLATVYGVVKEAGGSITVRSVPAHGSSFTVRLPLLEGPAPERTRPTASEPAQHEPAGWVLVVEDDAMVRTATVRILERAGYRVLSASGAARALELLAERDGDVDLLVSDVVMPGLSGWELHTRMSQRWPGIPTLFLSGHTDDIVGRDALSGPGIDFLAKPFAASSLLEKVESRLRVQAPV